MDIIFYLFVLTAVLVVVLAGIAIWAPRKLAVRSTAVVCALLVLPLAYGVFSGLLSKPKPQSFAWFEAGTEKAELLGASFAEGKAIYLWLRLEGVSEPRYYVLPWRKKAAEQLEDTINATTNSRASILIFKPFDNQRFSDLGELNIKVLPPPAAPGKMPRFPPRIFNPRATDI